MIEATQPQLIPYLQLKEDEQKQTELQQAKELLNDGLRRMFGYIMLLESFRMDIQQGRRPTDLTLEVMESTEKKLKKTLLEISRDLPKDYGIEEEIVRITDMDTFRTIFFC